MKFFRRLSIEWKLPLAFGGVLVVVVVALAWNAYLDVARASRSTAEHRLREVSNQFAGLLEAEATRAVTTLRQRAGRPELKAFLKAPSPRAESDALRALTDTLAKPEKILAIELRDNAGARVLAAGTDTGRIYSLIPASQFSHTAGDSGSVGPFFKSDSSIVLPTVVPVLEGGSRLGYLVEWRRIQSSAESRDQTLNLIGPGATFYLGRPGGVWTDQTGEVEPPPLNLGGVIRPMTYNRKGLGGRLGLASLVPGTPWTILIEFPESVVLAPANEFLRRVALIEALLSLLGMLSIWLLSRSITGPLRALTSASELISYGDYSGRARVRREDELGRLAGAFNTMASRVQETHDRLEASVTELRATREQFAQAQRMEAVGRLAGGVAHDFNNLLTVILGETELALIRPRSNDTTDLALKEIRRAGERAAILTRQLLTFSRRQLIEPTTFSLNELVADLEKMMGRLIGENIQLITNPDAVNPVILADRGQMEQVVVNLVVNARDAMPEGGIITIRTSDVRLDDQYAATRPDLAVGNY
ncbi:MAG: HAMP domain-containing protein, partial [Gemmatimonadota bacterium]